MRGIGERGNGSKREFGGEVGDGRRGGIGNSGPKCRYKVRKDAQGLEPQMINR